MSKQILWHLFSKPVPYEAALRFQENIHQLQLSRRRLAQSCPDILLLLEHRPVYTTGRRQLADELEDERNRLQRLGADWIPTNRGGETTFHGPGQIVGYPLLDLKRMSLSVRDYVCKLQNMLTSFAHDDHGVSTEPSKHTGVFVSPTEKLASIGVQVRHRLTTHGFSINITEEPIPWFRQVVACGLPDIEAVSIAGVKGGSPPITVNNSVEGLKTHFEKQFGTELHPVFQSNHKQVQELIFELEAIAAEAGPWKRGPGQ